MPYLAPRKPEMTIGHDVKEQTPSDMTLTTDVIFRTEGPLDKIGHDIGRSTPFYTLNLPQLSFCMPRETTLEDRRQRQQSTLPKDAICSTLSLGMPLKTKLQNRFHASRRPQVAIFSTNEPQNSIRDELQNRR